MTLKATESVIDALVSDARPVKRLRPPILRACGWLAVVIAIGAAAIALFADRAMMARHAQDREWLVEMAGTLATGCLAVIAAFELSLPDRSQRWTLLPLPALALWLSGSGLGCWRQWLARGEAGSLEMGETMHCFGFIVGIGVPLGLALLWALRRARPLSPGPVAVMGALGAAALAAFVLQFFHPFEVTMMDLGMHAFAVCVVLAVWGLGGRKVLA